MEFIEHESLRLLVNFTCGITQKRLEQLLNTEKDAKDCPFWSRRNRAKPADGWDKYQGKWEEECPRNDPIATSCPVKVFHFRKQDGLVGAKGDFMRCHWVVECLFPEKIPS